MAAAAAFSALNPLPPNAPQPTAQQEVFEPSQFGANGEKLPEDLQACLKSIIGEVTRRDLRARRWEVRRVRKARMFWRGEQHIWWDEGQGNFRLPFDQAQPRIFGEGDMPRYQYVTNIYQPIGLTIQAVLTQRAPTVQFMPDNALDPNDVAAAKMRTRAVEYLARKVRLKRVQADEAYYAYTDGKWGLYTRYAASKEMFGVDEIPRFEGQRTVVKDAAVVCPSCQSEYPAANFSPPLQCPKCGYGLTGDDIQPEQTAVTPLQTGIEEVPRGEVMMTCHGALELRTPVPIREQRDFPWLQYNREVDVAMAKAAFPHVADKIQPGSPSGGEESYERLSRMITDQGMKVGAQGADSLAAFVTISDSWLRRATFQLITDSKKRQQLEQLFPNGCKATFAGEQYAESRNESMDDCWVVMHAIPGDGQNRPAMGDSIIPIQEQVNDLMNVALEAYEYGLPSTFVDQEVVDLEALEEQSVEHGAMYPALAKPGIPLGNSFYTTPPAEASANMMKHLETMTGSLSQFISGALPAMFGGAMEDQKTARGYDMARKQAMGRMGLTWLSFQDGHPRAFNQAVKHLMENVDSDVHFSQAGPSGAFEGQVIEMAAMKNGKACACYPESDEAFPDSWSDRRDLLMTFLNNPEIAEAGIFALPENMEILKIGLGMTDIVLPGADATLKQKREIKVLLSSRSMMVPNPMTGMPEPQASLPIDRDIDQHAYEWRVCQNWMNSPEGQDERERNPDGFANVRAHALLHKAAMDELAQQPQTKPAQVTIAVDKMPPEAAAQLLEKKEGVNLTPQDFAVAHLMEQAKRRPQGSDGSSGSPPGPPGQTVREP